ncbi:hypothetical protein B0I31_11754 [Saccharothrix carnea]|uniref:Uncharacterized protein n=1 Tax=Saccharothrix carnea TaxID=1280637 RepID=A0A2P8I062_SACCR|nr:hypothetical protein [Saccharothrix carnea]PSL51860.1 hypothetical protein B0I31_11754 [Saccharothrix carnea]
MADIIYTDGQGRIRSSRGKKGGAGTVVAAGVLVLGLVGSAGAAGGGGVFGPSASGSAGSSGVAARKLDGQKAAKRGDRDGAWQRLGMRRLDDRWQRQVECLSASHGEVREFFAHTPCTSLDRVVIAVGDGAGNNAVVSVAWVGFRNTRDLRAFKRIEDRHGSGDIYPLGASLLGLADITFTGDNYGTDVDGTTITVAEAEPAAGHVDRETLDALAEVAAYLPRP